MASVVEDQGGRSHRMPWIGVALVCLVALPVLGAVRLQSSIDQYIPDPTIGDVGLPGALIAGFSALFGDGELSAGLGILAGWLWASGRRTAAVASVTAFVATEVATRAIKALAPAPRPFLLGDELFQVAGPPRILVVAIVIALVAVATVPRWRTASLAMAAAVTTLLLTTLALDALLPGSPTMSGYPSGHAAGSMAAAAIVVGAAWLTRARLIALSIAIVVVLGVAASRLYLDAHYPADILGGWCVALASVALVWVALDTWINAPSLHPSIRRVAGVRASSSALPRSRPPSRRRLP
jgi:membrane-associated phospholipid phosphatase